MKHLRAALCIAVLALYPTLAQARTGRCVLQVKGQTYLHGPCDIINQDNHGSFSIGVGDVRRSRYFAYVLMEDDGAHGYWNETPDASHAHTDLGRLKRDGACWRNQDARVCAYR